MPARFVPICTGRTKLSNRLQANTTDVQWPHLWGVPVIRPRHHVLCLRSSAGHHQPRSREAAMRRRLLCYYAILACICPSLCLAQIASRVPVLNFEKPPTTEADLPASETIRKDVDEVNLVFSVRDRGGHFVTDLQPHQVQVLDNRRPPESVRLFEAQTNLPLRVGLLVDGSDSVDARFGFEKTAAVNFLRQTLRAGSDQAFAVRFDASVHLVQDWTDNIQQLEQSILGMRVGGETALYDAV